MRVRRVPPQGSGAEMFARKKKVDPNVQELPVDDIPVDEEQTDQDAELSKLEEVGDINADDTKTPADEEPELELPDLDSFMAEDGDDAQQTPAVEELSLEEPAADTGTKDTTSSEAPAKDDASAAKQTPAPSQKPTAAPATPAPAAAAQTPSGIDINALKQAAQTAKTTATEVKKVQQAVGGLTSDDDGSPKVVASSLTTLRDLANVLRQMGFKFSLSNTRSEVLQTLANLNLAKVAKEVARIPQEQMASLISVFVPAAKLIPQLLAIGYKPVHNTGIDESYPATQQYELTLTNGLTNITVLGIYDWDASQELTTIRYATNAELLRYGLMQEGTVSVASPRAIYPSSHMPKSAPAIGLSKLNRLLSAAIVTDTGSFAADSKCLVSVSGNYVAGKIRGFISDVALSSTVAIVDLSDGYYIADMDRLYVSTN